VCAQLCVYVCVCVCVYTLYIHEKKNNNVKARLYTRGTGGLRDFANGFFMTVRLTELRLGTIIIIEIDMSTIIIYM
jgi:hypothetical protein